LHHLLIRELQHLTQLHQVNQGHLQLNPYMIGKFHMGLALDLFLNLKILP